MKKYFFVFSLFILVATVASGQEIMKGIKNNVFLLKGSRAMPQCRFKDGSLIMMKNEEDGMSFTMIKNGKETPMFDPIKDCIYGQVCEMDIDGDGKMEILIGTRLTAESFEVKIYKKAEFEFDYKLFTTINGSDHCEFPGDNTAKIYTADLTVTHIKFKSDGSWVTLEQ